jgi:hypothetical protein
MLTGLLLCLTALLVPQQDDQAAFEKRFQQAVKVSDRVAMDRAVMKYKTPALASYMLKVERTKWGDDWLNEFASAWKRVHRSDFPKIYGEYLDTLDGSQKTARALAVDRLRPLYALNVKAIGSRSREDWQQIIQVLEPGGLMMEFVTLDDKYYLAICDSFLANAYFTSYSDGGGDNFQAYKAAEAFQNLRKDLDYTNDATYSSVDRIIVELRATLGIEDPKLKDRPAPKASPFTINPAEGADWIDVPLEFYLEKKPGSIEHPCDIADLDTHSWRYMAFGKPGEKTQFFPSYGDDDCLFAGPRGRVFLNRIKDSKFVIEAGAEPSEEFKLSLKPSVVRFQQKLTDGTVVEQALMVATGSEADMIQGIEVNAGFNENGGLIFFRNLSGRRGKTPFGDLKIFDYDGDGLFSRQPVRVASSVAMPKEIYYKRFDSVLLGKTKKALPTSRWISTTKGQWFEVEWPEGPEAKNIRLRMANPTLAPLVVNYKAPKGLKLVSLILRSESSQTEGLLIDVSGKGPQMVPIGRYVFDQGLLRGKDGAECLIQPPTDIPFVIIVDKLDENKLDFGGPYTLQANAMVEDGQVSLDRESIRVVGLAGETYMMNIKAPLNGIKVEIKGGKSFELSQPEKEEVNLDWHAAYFPVSGSVRVPKSGKVVYRLSLKKHPWFGKLSSDWLKFES